MRFSSNIYLVTSCLVILVVLATTCFGQPKHGSFRINLHRKQPTSDQLDELERCLRASYKLVSNATSGSPYKSCHHAVRSIAFQPFVGQIQIGTPPQTFLAMFDTGSDVLWVPHTACRLNGATWKSGPEEAKKFASQQSSSFERIGRERVSIRYANQMEFSGWWVSDQVQIPDARDESRTLVVANQGLALVCQITDPHDQYTVPCDALVGLSFPTNNSGQVSTLFENLIKSNQLSEPVFSFYTQKSDAANNKQIVNGQIIFGQLDETLYTGPITWAPLTHIPHWTIRVESIRVLGRGVPRSGPQSPKAFACAYGCGAVIDTGANIIMGPDGEVAHLNEQLGFGRNRHDTSLFLVNGSCAQHRRSQDNMSLVVEISGTHLELGSEFLMSDVQALGGDPVCVSALRSHGQAVPRWQLGSPFIWGFYTIFDYGQKRVGFAQSV